MANAELVEQQEVDDENHQFTQAQVVEACIAIEAGVFAQERLDRAAANDEYLDSRLKFDLQSVRTLGNHAFDLMILKHMGMVRSIANMYRGRGVEVEDLVHEGVVGADLENNPTDGLVHAIWKYDYKREMFSTYARYWVHKAMIQAISNHGSSVRLTRRVRDNIKTVHETRDKLLADNGRPANRGQMLAATGFSPDRYDTARMAAVHQRYGVQSLDLPVAENSVSDEPLSVLLEDETDGFEVVEERDLLGSIGRYLSADELYYLRLNTLPGPDGKPYSQKAIAAMTGRGVATINSMLKAARERLRRAFIED